MHCVDEVQSFFTVGSCDKYKSPLLFAVLNPFICGCGEDE